MREGAPIRFLFVILCGWTGLRLVTLLPVWSSDEADVPEVARALPGAGQADAQGPPPAETAAVAGATSNGRSPRATARNVRPIIAGRGRTATPAARPNRNQATEPAGSTALAAAAPRPPRQPTTGPGTSIPATATAQAPFLPPPAALPFRAARWSGSVWLLARREGGAALAPGGTLGGSQAWARLLYRLNGDRARPLALSARVYAPLRRTRGAEAAIGLDWRPSARVPIHVLVERRQRLGREGRSAFAVAAYGGGGANLGRGWRLDGYAQAGMVGARSRNAFIDGSARVSRTVGPVEVGAAVWGAAQPGAARLDAGPQLALPIRAGGAALRLSAEYRFRLAGDARPASGPALTLGVDF